MLLTNLDILSFRKLPENSTASFLVDYGLTKVSATRKGKIIHLDNYNFDLSANFKSDLCYLLNSTGIHPIAFFDDTTKKYYKLLATPDWPTTAISSVPMHRLSSPKIDTENKINSLNPHGRILDTCMGMGYTAILCSTLGREVYTFEKDSNMLFIAKLNPCSTRLFTSPNIKIKEEDITTAISSFPAEYFDYIVHDPPTFKIAPDLFTEKFYKKLYRALQPNGKIFHYVPLYKVKSGYDFPATIAKKLKTTGFKISAFSEKTSGFICKKKKIRY